MLKSEPSPAKFHVDTAAENKQRKRAAQSAPALVAALPAQSAYSQANSDKQTSSNCCSSLSGLASGKPELKAKSRKLTRRLRLQRTSSFLLSTAFLGH